MVERFDLNKMLEEVKDDKVIVRKSDRRLSRAGLRKLVEERRRGGKDSSRSK